MAHVITIRNENVTLFSMADFEFQVEKHMGHEALEYLREQNEETLWDVITSAIDTIESLVSENNRSQV